MFEFNGWISVNYHTHDIDLKKQEKCFEVICNYLRNHSQLDSQNYKLVNHNGLNSVIISGCHNHKQHYVLGIFKWIAEKAIGSYGVLYIRDDEDNIQIGDSNKFKVWVMKRGEVLEYSDCYLSPIIPSVED